MSDWFILTVSAVSGFSFSLPSLFSPSLVFVVAGLGLTDTDTIYWDMRGLGLVWTALRVTWLAMTLFSSIWKFILIVTEF